jgi:4-hydroxybenzoate polyprenyltransferase
MNTKDKILEYFRLIRFSTVGNEAGVILLGAFIMGQRNISHIILLFAMGLLGHIYGYVLNEYADVEVDKKLSYHIKKRLVSGVIPKEHALIISFSACFCAYILTFIFFSSLLSILLLSIAVILTIIYDFFGKKIPFSDFIVAGTLSIFLLFGASTVSIHLTGIAYIVSFMFFFDVVFMNFVEGGLKDIDHDYLAGAKTMATRMGVMIKDNKLIITTSFKTFAYILRALYFSLIILLGFQPEINLWLSDVNGFHIIVVFLMVVVIISSYKLLHFTTFDKPKMKRLFTIINSSSVALMLIMLYPLLGFWATLALLLLPITWFVVFNVVLYGKPLQPLV